MSPLVKVYEKRKWKNWLLQPFLQIELGLYGMLLALCFSGIAFFILEKNIQNFYEIILAMGIEDRDFIKESLDHYIFWTESLLAAILMIYVLTLLAMTIIYTHRLVGPTVAFCQQIKRLQNEDYSQDVILRKYDAFQEVADELNHLTTKLRATQKQNEII